jgi:hypothetical protein
VLLAAHHRPVLIGLLAQFAEPAALAVDLPRLADLARRAVDLAWLAELSGLTRLADLPRLALGGLGDLPGLARLGLLCGEHGGGQRHGGGGNVQKLAIHRVSSCETV